MRLTLTLTADADTLDAVREELSGALEDLWDAERPDGLLWSWSDWPDDLSDDRYH